MKESWYNLNKIDGGGKNYNSLEEAKNDNPLVWKEDGKCYCKISNHLIEVKRSCGDIYIKLCECLKRLTNNI